MEKICEECGRSVLKEDLFCTYCGIELERNVEEKTEGETKKIKSLLDSPYAPLTFKKCLGMGLILFIPIVNIIMLLIWIFDKEGNISQRNLAKASLFYIVIGGLLITIITSIVLREIITELYYFQPDYYDYHIETPLFQEWIHASFPLNRM